MDGENQNDADIPTPWDTIVDDDPIRVQPDLDAFARLQEEILMDDSAHEEPFLPAETIIDPPPMPPSAQCAEDAIVADAAAIVAPAPVEQPIAENATEVELAQSQPSDISAPENIPSLLTFDPTHLLPPAELMAAIAVEPADESEIRASAKIGEDLPLLSEPSQSKPLVPAAELNEMAVDHESEERSAAAKIDAGEVEADFDSDPAEAGAVPAVILEYAALEHVADDFDEPIDPEPLPARTARSGAWTIPLLCAGLALIAACMIIPQTEANRQIVYEREKLRADLEHLQKQVSVNAEFLKKVEDDSTIAERLAQRQMKFIRQGTSILELTDEQADKDLSPFILTNVPPPEPLGAYRPHGGHFAALCSQPRSQLYIIGAGLMLLAIGLVLGEAPEAT